jgi:hypothetical protein
MKPRRVLIPICIAIGFQPALSPEYSRAERLHAIRHVQHVFGGSRDVFARPAVCCMSSVSVRHASRGMESAHCHSDIPPRFGPSFASRKSRPYRTPAHARMLRKVNEARFVRKDVLKGRHSPRDNATGRVTIPSPQLSRFAAKPDTTTTRSDEPVRCTSPMPAYLRALSISLIIRSMR